MRAVVEAQMTALLRHSRWMGVTVDVIHVTGGAAANRQILQVLADVFGAGVRRLDVSNAAALGAALRALHADRLDDREPITWDTLVTSLEQRPPDPRPADSRASRRVRRATRALRRVRAARTPLSGPSMYPRPRGEERRGLVKALVLGALLAVTWSTAAAAQDAAAVVAEVTRAMGVTGLKAITFSGSAAFGNFGQSRTISFGLASTSIPIYIRTIDFRASGVARRRRHPSAAGARRSAAAAGHLSAEHHARRPCVAQQLQIWTTPWGFLLGAASHRPTLQARTVEGVRYRVVSWTPDQKAPSGAAYRLEGFLDDADVLVKVDTWVEHPIMGDLLVETPVLRLPGRRWAEGAGADPPAPGRDGNLRHRHQQRARQP